MTGGPRRRRLDAELVRRGMAGSREQAVGLIEAGSVAVAGRPAHKAATQVDVAAPIVVDAGRLGPDYASRGGRKLAAALEVFPGLLVRGRRCLDAGASTGGFCDVLLQAGAAHVVAVDVGYGQLAWRLRSDERVTVVDRTNVRELEPRVVGEPVGLVTADLSFISLTLALAPLVRCAATDADYLLLVKPQFEVGRELLGSRGVVREAGLRADAVRQVAATGRSLGLGACGVTASAAPGPAGNVEYFLWLRRGAPELDPAELGRAMGQVPG